MALTAESGWPFGEIGYGPDKKAGRRKAIDEYRSERGRDACARWSSADEKAARQVAPLPSRFERRPDHS